MITTLNGLFELSAAGPSTCNHKQYKFLIFRIVNSDGDQTVKFCPRSYQFRGVELLKASGKYFTTINIKDETINLGLWITAKDAAIAYDRAVHKYRFDEPNYQRLNFPDMHHNLEVEQVALMDPSIDVPSSRLCRWRGRY